MPNTLTSLNREFWANEAQESLFVDNHAMAIANTRLINLAGGEGDTVNRVTMSYPASEVYVPGTDITGDTLSGGSEALSIGTWITSKVTVDDTEKKQSLLSIGQLAMKRMMADHNNRIEQAVLSEVSNARFSLSDGNVGGVSGNNLILNTNNVTQLLTAADTKLDAIDAPKEGRTWVLGGHALGTLKLNQAGRQTQFGDGVNTRGVVAEVLGWKILYSNNLPYSATLDMTTIPVAGDTITIASVVFTARADGAATGAGGFSIQATAALACAQLVNAINNVGTPGVDTFIQLSAEDRFLLNLKRRVVATDNTTNLTIAGFGDIVVSETLTPAGSVWSAQKQTSMCLVAGSIDIVVQIPPEVEVLRDPDQWADIVRSLVGYGKKTFADGARKMVSVPIDASTSDWS